MIYLIRHGIAEAFANSDFERELTTEGKIKAIEGFESFKKYNDLKNFVVYSSPLVRAEQTAEIFCKIFECEYEIKEELSEGSDYIPFINSLDEETNYVLIGHEPSISSAIYHLTGRIVGVSRGSIHIINK